MSKAPLIAVAGAGAIGLYVGGLLAFAGHRVRLWGRAGRMDEIKANGLTLTDYTGARITPDAQGYSLFAGPEALEGADIVLVAVKSRATADMARTIAAHAPTAQVISLQNGISNPGILRAALPDADVRGAMVPFNVVQTGPGQYHCASSGVLQIEAGVSDLAQTLSSDHLAMETVQNFEAVQWGKLLVNLNNALNALSGLPLLEQLQDRAWRQILAAQMSETLAVLSRAGITPARFTPIPPALVPHLLRLPTPIFRRAARAMLTIDPEARSSMQDDLSRGRLTEIDALQGAVLALAAKQGASCPAIEKVTAAIRKAEAEAKGPPMMSPAALR